MLLRSPAQWPLPLRDSVQQVHAAVVIARGSATSLSFGPDNLGADVEASR